MAEPKIPPEYAAVAKKIGGEAINRASSFSDELSKLANDLSGDLENRSVESVDALKSAAPAAIFDKSENGSAPIVNSPSDFSVSLDQLLGKTGAPKEVKGTGAMSPALDPSNPLGVDVKGGYVNKYDPKSGVLMEGSGYTPDQKTSYPHDSYPLTPRSGGRVAADIRIQNEIQNETERVHEFTHPDSPQLFLNKPVEAGTRWNQIDNGYVENIPAIAGGAVGAGVLLSSQNADARERPLSEDLQVDTGSVSTPKISLTQKAAENSKNGRNNVSGSVTENGNTSVIADELQNFASAVKERATNNLSTFASDVSRSYGKFQAEKDQLNIRAQEFMNASEVNNGMLSDDDKELMKDAVGVMEGSPAVAVSAVADTALDLGSKFNHQVIQPIVKATQGAIKRLNENQMEILRDKAPSLAVIAETAYYPLIGSTGWNIKPGAFGGITQTDADNQNAVNQLDPSVRKLLDDKAALLGKEGGQALLVTANKFSELPMWLIGGSSELGLMVGGMVNEVADDNGNPVRGAVTGLGFGKALGAIAGSGPVRKGISLLDDAASKFKLSPAGLMDAFGKVTYDSNSEHVQKLWQAITSKNIEPVLMMTGKTATKMADDAMLKATPDVSEAMNTKVVAPQALVLSIDAATGKPVVYGVKDGLYGVLNEHVNPEGRPVMITQLAKQEFTTNRELINTWNDLIDTKRKTPPTTKHGIDEWTPDVIPPENAALVFAWKKATEGGGMMEVYRAGSRDFNKDLLKSRVPVRVEFTGPDGRPDTGIGFWGAGGDVIFAPDVSDNIPGAIPKDLTFKQTRINPNVPASGIPEQNQAWEINHLTDDDLYKLVDDIKARDDLQREADAEAARGNTFSDNVPIEKPPAPFDGDAMSVMSPALAMAGSALTNHANASAAAAALVVSFLPPSRRAIGKALTKVNNAMGKAGLISDTVYGEVFKIDASIQAYSTRHYKRLTEDLNKQLINSFKDAASTPAQRQQFNAEVKAFIEGTRSAPPQQLNQDIQLKVQKYVAERNYEWALIEQLGGTVPDKAPGGNAELEKMFALDYFETKDGEVNPWLQRMRKQQNVSTSLINLLGDKKASKATKNLGHYDQVMGRMSGEIEMARDYMDRKLQISQLSFMKELSQNVEASSPAANPMLGHDKQVDFNGSGLLKGRWVSEETYKAIHTYPQDQKMLQNTMLGVVNMVKFNKTVLNPTTWVKNVMGNVWGVMNSNIVSSWNMHYRMPRGISIMNKDIAAFNKDVMANDARVHRVHETLKFGLLGAEFESSRTKMSEVLNNLAEPVAQTSNKTWGENLTDKYFKMKDQTLGAAAHLYSKVDMATKYSLYVNGLERWGIDLGTNKVGTTANARRAAADLLGASVVNKMFNTDELSELIKREVVRRIHLSLPMVDRIGTVPTAINKMSPITNPWLRTQSELTRITLQMPYRMYNEKGYAVNALKTASFLGTILGVNYGLRRMEGIDDRVADDAKTIAPKNVTDYMPGATATKFYSGEGNDKGLVYLDFANALIEPAQWFKGGQVDSGGDAAKRIGANGIDMVMGGGLLQDESKDAQSALGLTDSPQNFNVPFWKQNDTVRYITQKAVSAGPQVFSNLWQLYSTANMPKTRGLEGMDIPKQPMPMQVLKSLGIPVASMGSENQRKYKLLELDKRNDDLNKQLDSVGFQREGSSTGAYQGTYDRNQIIAKLKAEILKNKAEIDKVKNTKAVK